MKLIILMTALFGLNVNAEECSQTAEVCGCQTVCSNYRASSLRQPFFGQQGHTGHLELRYSPRSVLNNRRPGSKPVIFCNAQDSRDCVTIHR